jgi:hypothetical protein
MPMRILKSTVLLNLLLGACSGTHEIEAVYVPPSAPTEAAVGSGVKKIAADAKLSGALEISAVRPTDHGPGRYFFCVREAGIPPDQPRKYYSIFFDNDKYGGSRLSVILDKCEAQTYGPPPTVSLPKLDVASGQ